MANRWFTQFFYTLHKKPVLLDCNFIVDSTNGNGLGIRSLKGPGISAVYMHTSATPDPANPNPAAGYILVKLQDSYQRYFGGFSGQVTPLTGSNLTATVASVPNVITSLGTASLAQWQAVGLPIGITPAVGVAFIATSSATIGGSAAVQLVATAGSGIDHIEVVGDTNLALRPVGVTGGGYIVLRCMLSNATATPANGTAIGLSFYLSSSFLMQQGE